jgi:hypothetical protein
MEHVISSMGNLRVPISLGDSEMATFETLLGGLAILAVALESHGTALVLGGLAAWFLMQGGA